MNDSSTPVQPLLHALVIACPMTRGTKQELQATITHASYALLEDIMAALGTRDADESLGDPPAAGIWIWEGRIVVTGHNGGYYGDDYDVEYVGTYRKVNIDELNKLVQGEPLEWFLEEEPDDEPEDPS